MPTNEDNIRKNPKRTKGILFDEKQWLFIQKRYNLSSRELQVAVLLCRGFSNLEIGEALEIQTGTVKTHLRNLYRSFRVNNKVLLILSIIDDVIERYYVPAQLPINKIPIQEIPAKDNSQVGVADKPKHHS